MKPVLAIAAAAAALLLIVCVRAQTREPFYTTHAIEEPTRSYTPYVGTVPLGSWGVRPWAVEVDGPFRATA